MHVALDAYPLFGPRTGVGTYVHRLVDGLARLPDPPQLTLPVASLRALDPPLDLPGVTWRHRRVPFRVVQALWDRGRFPPGEWVTGEADLFHATNFVAPPFRHTPLVTTVHDLAHELHPDLVDHRVARYRHWVPDAIRRSQRVITLAAATADDLAVRYDVDRDRVVPIHLGVDESWGTAVGPDVDWRVRHGIPDRYLLFVGAPSQRKNFGLLLEAHEAARAVDAAVPPLVVAGPPPPDAMREPGSDVEVLGYLEERALQRVVAGAVALLYPSRYEGFGLPILEALATGTAVVASDLPVHREIAGDQVDLVDLSHARAEENLTRLRDAIVRASSIDAPPSLVSARRAWARGFTWDRTAAATREVYEAAVG
ncbi:MAG: glycosyltransferase family 4 protein [Acidimicrobiales bacterium]